MEKKKTNSIAKKDEVPTTNAVLRTMKVIEILSQNQNSQLEELVEKIDIARPTLFRFLTTLQQLDYVRKDKDNRYALTPKLFSIASRSLDQVELSKIARPLMEKLSAETGETSILGILDEDEALYVTKIGSKYNIRYYERIGKKVPLYCTAMGKILLAGMDKSSREEYFSKARFIPYSSTTIRSAAILRSEIDDVIEKGFAVNKAEYQDDEYSLACPIHDNNGKIIAAITICWPIFRDEPKKMEFCLEKTKIAAAMVSQLMGHVEKL